GRAAKVGVLTRGGLALCLKGRRRPQGQRGEKSAEAIVVAQATKGRTKGRAKRPLFSGCHATETKPKLGRTNGRRGEAARAALACGRLAGAERAARGDAPRRPALAAVGQRAL